jgi:hypothetical protein
VARYITGNTTWGKDMNKIKQQGIYEQFVRDASAEYQKTNIWVGGNFNTYILKMNKYKRRD